MPAPEVDLKHGDDGQFMAKKIIDAKKEEIEEMTEEHAK